MKAASITTTKYAKRMNCIWRTTRNPLIITVVGKFVKGGCYLKIHLNKELVLNGDEDGSPTIQETRVENLSLGEGSIPRAMGRNAKDDYAFQQKMVASLRFMVEQNAIAAEERNHRHKEWAKQLQEKMDDMNIGKLWPNKSCLPPTIILQWRMMMMIIDLKFKLVVFKFKLL
ncbi:nodulin-26-like [Pyrus ussuriensis x Pyrus communis]|uniref:Nodulin-26-like n=1 Tax=Pyrus ussuriensis x Pyrus communis TaxID=2448454 RepID=A0A5N5G7N5_9ROSA|nr:nodulin-26-like [Pyrus ussuriensis x Pyrus communis]